MKLIMKNSIVVRNRLSLWILAESEKHDCYKVCILFCQIIKCFGVTMFLWVQWILSPATCLDRFLQMLFVVGHFGVIGCISDVFPTLVR